MGLAAGYTYSYTGVIAVELYSFRLHCMGSNVSVSYVQGEVQGQVRQQFK